MNTEQAKRRLERISWHLSATARNVDRMRLLDASQELPVYTVEELAKHKNEESCWIALDGLVYDVTEFLDEHPGGGDLIVDEAGAECLEPYDDVGHTEEAQEMLLEFLIGTLEPI